MRRAFFYLPVFLLSVLACTLGACSVESKSTSAAAPAVPARQPVWFTDVTAAAGLGGFRHQNGLNGKKWYPEQMGSGGGFIDYDGDGWQDILLMGGGTWDEHPEVPPQALWLFRNKGDGTFTDVTEEAGLKDISAYSIGMAAADYDNDGDEDFYLTNLEENMLFRNDPQGPGGRLGRFTEVGKQAGVVTESVWSSSPIFFDADRDGHVDLYVANYVDWSPETDIFCPEGGTVKLYCHPAVYTGIQSRYYHNNGDGTFTERTKEAGFMPTLGKSLGVAELDFNKDGWPDLAVANDGEGDLLYQNNGDGTFTEMGVRSGFAFSEHGEARAGMGIDSGVVDSTGEVTIFVGNFSEEMVGVYRHVGNGFFADRAALSRIGYPTLLSLTFGLFLFDAEYDGDLDLLIANGHVHPDRTGENNKITYRQAAQLFLNRGDGTFEEHKPEAGVFTEKLVARGAAYADYDRDGDLDVLLTENNAGAHLWRNELNPAQTKSAHYLRVRLEGTRSNRDGLGARLVARAGEHPMERRLRTGSSYLSQSEKVASFGLGSSQRVDVLEVYWPSGEVERFEHVPANQEIRIREGAGAFEKVKPGRGAVLAAEEPEAVKVDG